MIHVLLRIAVWVAVLGIGYLVLGPEVFDSSRQASPFEGQAKLYLPPVKTRRQLELEDTMTLRALGPDELNEYRALARQRESQFWQQQGVSVEEALAGVQTRRRARLAEVLEQRGLSREEAAVFFLVVERDHPALLADRE